MKTLTKNILTTSLLLASTVSFAECTPNYVVAGDSTRSINVDLKPFLQNVAGTAANIVIHSQPGHTNNLYLTGDLDSQYPTALKTIETLNECNGSIVELSLGINDSWGYSVERITNQLVETVTMIQEMSPTSHILLVEPVRQELDLAANERAKTAYANLSTITGLPVYSSSVLDTAVQDSELYQGDLVHPTQRGLEVLYKSLLNQMFNIDINIDNCPKVELATTGDDRLSNTTFVSEMYIENSIGNKSITLDADAGTVSHITINSTRTHAVEILNAVGNFSNIKVTNNFFGGVKLEADVTFTAETVVIDFATVGTTGFTSVLVSTK